MRANERPRLCGTEAAASGSEVAVYNSHSTTAPALMGPFPTEPPSNHQPVTPEPTQPITLADALAQLTAILAHLARVIEKTENRSQTDRMALRIEELADAIGVSRRVLERELSAGRFPKPDKRIGRMPVWGIAKVRGWLERSSA